jgi:hypothetical protein
MATCSPSVTADAPSVSGISSTRTNTHPGMILRLFGILLSVCGMLCAPLATMELALEIPATCCEVLAPAVHAQGQAADENGRRRALSETTAAARQQRAPRRASTALALPLPSRAVPPRVALHDPLPERPPVRAVSLRGPPSNVSVALSHANTTTFISGGFSCLIPNRRRARSPLV